MHEFMPLKPFLVLSQWTCQIHYFRSKTHVLAGSMPFRSRTWHIAKTGIEVHLMHEFMPLEPFLGFLQQKLIFWVFSHHFGAPQCPFGFAPHTLCLRLVFQVVSCHFIAAPDPLWKSISGALNARVYAPETISCFVTMNMPNPLFQV